MQSKPTHKDTEKALCLEVNGQMHRRLVSYATTLLEFLREDLNLTGTKCGCDLGECGCCTVLVDDKPVLSCLLLAVETEGKKVRTIEDIASGAQLHPVQEAMVEHGAIQCGFCTPAMVVNGVHLVEKNQKPTVQEIKTCISGTLCRCTGYTKIEKALLDVTGQSEDQLEDQSKNPLKEPARGK